MHPIKALAVLFVALLMVQCSDETERECTEEGAEEHGGIKCCPSYCGASTTLKSPRYCHGGKWVCEKGVVEKACASPHSACTIKQNCSHSPGLGQEEPDPAPELCCVGGCDGTKAVHRVCKYGLEFECPTNSVPISKNCKDDYVNACGGILKKYKDNNWKLP